MARQDLERLSPTESEAPEDFALALLGARDGHWVWDLKGDRLHVTGRWCSQFGLEPIAAELEPDFWFDRVNREDLSLLRQGFEDVGQGKSQVLVVEHRIRRADGVELWVLAHGRPEFDDQGQVIKIGGSLSDTTARRVQASTLRNAKRQDAVTELPRRAVLMERIARCMELTKNHKDYSFGLVMLEVDRLEAIVEALGARSAERLLSGIARRLEAAARHEDLLTVIERGRFAILVENLNDPTEAARLMARVHDALRPAFDLEGELVFASVTAGVALSSDRHDDVEDVLADARQAVRRAHAGSSEDKPLFDKKVQREALSQLRLEMALHDALENQEFELYYQPIVDYERWNLFGFEALLRWKHPQRGMISPGEFIPVAEATGLIIPIGRWAFQEAGRQLRAWLDAHELPERFALSINLSMRQTQDPDLYDLIQKSIEEHDLPRRVLKLELTESVVMNDPEEGIKLFERLRAGGIQLYIDDFGTGYSSLSYLHRFPIDGLKVDRAFVSELDGSQESATIVRTILDLASNLNVDVVAEGVETSAQAEQLLGMGCNRLQGFHFSRPLTADRASALLAEGSGAFRSLGGLAVPEG